MKFVELEVELLDHQPRSWRRFLVPKTGATLEDVHHALQAATGWDECHLAAFASFDDEPLAQLHDDDFGFGGPPVPLFAKVSLASVRAKTGSEFLYNYDFGDDWWCAVIVRGEVDVDADARAFFVGGEGPWPPDDCGGIPGFEALLKTLAKRDAKKKLTADERSTLEWLGDGWTPDLKPNRLPLLSTTSSPTAAQATTKQTATKKTKKKATTTKKAAATKTKKKKKKKKKKATTKKQWLPTLPS